VYTAGKTAQVDFGEHSTEECEFADHLGVVFVHGVGFQNPGETLLSWSDRLIRMLAARHAGHITTPADLVHRSEIDLDGGKLSSIELRIPGVEDQRPQHWLLTEAFWAASIQPPSVPEVLRWLGARGGAALAAVGPAKALRNSVYLTGIAIGTLVVYGGIRALTAIIPIESVRTSVIAPLDRLLTGWSGDIQVLLFDPGQSANVRTRVLQAITGVADAGFARVAMVAHSGGAVASYMTLTDDPLWSAAAEKEKAPAVVTLVTLGQGLNVAWRLCGVGDGASCDGAIGSARRLTGDLHRNNASLRWYDYYSEGDTVSETDLRPPECLAQVVPGELDRYPIENVPANPHGTYWDNDEEFLLPLVQRLEVAARTPVPDAPAPAFRGPDTTRRAFRLLRIGMFSLTSRILFATMAAAIVGGALLGGARLDDLGAAVADFVSDIPVLSLLAVPPEWVRDVTSDGWWWDALRAIGMIVVSVLFVLGAIFPLLRLGPRKLAWERLRSPLQRRLVRAVDVTAAVLAAVPFLAWLLLLVSTGGKADVAPWWAVTPALILVSLGLAWTWVRAHAEGSPRQVAAVRVESALRSGLGVMGLVAVVALLVVGTVVAVLGDADYGGAGLGALTLGAVVTWVLYRLLAGVANWRWQAWDEQEREQFRQTLEPGDPTFKDRPWGRRIDMACLAFASVAAVVLAGAIGAPLIGPGAAAWAGVIVGVLVVGVWLIGVAQDSANSRSGVKPAEMTPLPQSAA
jgi:hypothetical protein